MTCQLCEQEFTPKITAQKFCCKSHTVKFHNMRKVEFFADLRRLAADPRVSAELIGIRVRNEFAD